MRAVTDLPLVSIIIPTRDRPASLARAIDSVVRQKYRAWELVIIDDGSSVPVELESSKRMRLVRNEVSIGPSRARNQGSDAAHGDLIAFLDDDDFYLPDKLGAVVDCLNRHKAAGSLYHLVRFEGHSHESQECYVDFAAVTRMLTSQPPHPSGLVVRRHVHQRVRFDEDFDAAADLDYALRLALDGPIVRLPTVLAEHGSMTDTVSLVPLENRIRGRLQFMEKHRSLMTEPRMLAYHHLRLGHLYRRSGHKREAFREFGHALNFRPQFGSAYKGLVSLALPRIFLDYLSRSKH